MNVGTEHICIEAFHEGLHSSNMELEALRKLSMVNKEWRMAADVPLKQKKIDIIRNILDFVGEDGVCRIGRSNVVFDITNTKVCMDLLCQVSKRLAEWQNKSRRQRIPDYSIIFSESMFNMQIHPDADIEIDLIMNTMRLLIAGTHNTCFAERPALKLCWLYLLCKYILNALEHDLYPEVFTSKTFSAVVIHKLQSFRAFLRSNVKKVPDRLRYHLITLFDELETRMLQKAD